MSWNHSAGCLLLLVLNAVVFPSGLCTHMGAADLIVQGVRVRGNGDDFALKFDKLTTVRRHLLLQWTQIIKAVQLCLLEGLASLGSEIW